ncbi:MAG: GNAT family N-acetyltransferase, partial [Chloroflexota bacterium]
GHRLHPLKPFERYSFCASSLTEEHMASLVDSSPYRDRIAPLDASLINCLAQRPEGYFDLSDFDGVDDFLARGYGFTIPDGDDLMGVAYSSLVCSRGIEVSVYIEEKYRMKGAATALAARLVLECLRHGLRPNWDAANPESCRLAERLGYHLRESYKAYYYT